MLTRAAFRDLMVALVAVGYLTWRLAVTVRPLNWSSRSWCDLAGRWATGDPLMFCADTQLTPIGLAIVGVAAYGALASIAVLVFELGAGRRGAVLAMLLWAVMVRSPNLAQHGAYAAAFAGDVFVIGLAQLVQAARPAPSRVRTVAAVAITTAALIVIGSHIAVAWSAALVVVVGILLKRNEMRIASAAAAILFGVGLTSAAWLMMADPNLLVGDWQFSVGSAELGHALRTIPADTGRLIWLLGGPLLAVALFAYLRPSWRLATAHNQEAAWLLIMAPLAPLIAEALVSDQAQWYRCHIALIPFVVIPARIWRGL